MESSLLTSIGSGSVKKGSSMFPSVSMAAQCWVWDWAQRGETREADVKTFDPVVVLLVSILDWVAVHTGGLHVDDVVRTRGGEKKSSDSFAPQIPKTGSEEL